MTRGLCLVIEDNRDIRDLISLILTGAGFEIYGVGNGAEALRAAAVLQPVLITLDVGLPDMDGRDVAQGLSVVCPAPIIMITAHAGTDTELDGMAAGTAAHLTKPFKPSDLRKIVDRVCP